MKHRRVMVHASTCLAAVLIGAAAQAQDLPKVTVAAAKIEGATQQITLPASLEPYERVSLYGKVTGYLDELRVDVGSRVKAGEPIARISVPEMVQQLKLGEAKVLAAKAAVARAQAHAGLKKVTHDRLAKLYEIEAGAVAQLDVEVAGAEVQAAEAEVSAARSGVDVAAAEVNAIKAMLDYAVIKAPFDAVVTQRQMDLGALVTAGATARPIVDLARVSKLRLSFDIPERLLTCIAPDQKVRFTIEALPGGNLQGTIARTSGLVDPRTRSMKAEVDVDNAQNILAPGMYATVRFAVTDLRSTVVVPATALRSSGGHAAVFTVDNGLVKKLPVLVLIDDGKEAAVSGPVAAGSMVITAGPSELADGQRVEARAVEAAK